MIDAAPSVGAVSAPWDERFMRLALALGERHLGLTWPNPSVGALVVDERGGVPRVVAQGITQPGGRPHAERVALAGAGPAARGATLYVSLEPCSHHGRTPPCADAVREAGVARVVTALEDPDPRVSGRGHALLRAAGIAVTPGLLSDQARRLHRGHVLRVTRGRPAVTLKLARTADGFAARGAHSRRAGGRLLITGETANGRIHLMRAHADAIMVGVGTILGDDPLLTVRLPGLENRSPVRVVIDSRLRTPPTARVVTSAATIPTWVIATEHAPVEAERHLVEAGVEVLKAPASTEGVDLASALNLLGARGITRVFSEGGPRLAGSLIAADLVDDVAVLTSATALGEYGIPAIGPGLRRALEQSFEKVGTETLGPDRLDLFEKVR